jgi:hypothetical protein
MENSWSIDVISRSAGNSFHIQQILKNMTPFIRETDIRAFDNGDNPVHTSAITVSSVQICII